MSMLRYNLQGYNYRYNLLQSMHYNDVIMGAITSQITSLTIVYSTVFFLFRRRSKITSKPRVTGLCEGNSPGTGEFPAQTASNTENVSIWWHHHDEIIQSTYWCNYRSYIWLPIILLDQSLCTTGHSSFSRVSRVLQICSMYQQLSNENCITRGHNMKILSSAWYHLEHYPVYHQYLSRH